MGMIKCPECGRMISDRAPMCMGCGITKEDIQEMLASDRKKTDAEKDWAYSIDMWKTSPICPLCGTPRPDGQDICSNCGISFRTVARMINCQTCGKKISIFASVCPGCGNPEKMMQTLLDEQNAEKKDTVMEYKTDIGSRKIRCAICKTEFNPSVNLNCPKCSYPPLTFRNKTPAMQEFVKAYRKKAGILTLELQVGQSYKMGRYGGEEINWRVLATEPGKALLISENGLDAKPYNETWKSITWAECTLRKWLNTDFISQAFSHGEYARIMNTKLHAEKNPKYSTDPGQNTADQVFLLSMQEVEKYFRNNEDRQTFPTQYARNNGAYVNGSTKCSWWWLRSPGHYGNYAASVNSVGEVLDYGFDINYGDGCVRPALWINLES